MSNPTIVEAEAITKRYGKQMVIILHLDGDSMGYVSYGATKRLCAEAHGLGDIAFEAITTFLSE